ncbi:MAG: ABC transporter permease subunit, partial [Phycisphaerae bacterium]
MGKIASTIRRVPTIVGPLFTKELLVTSRRPRYYLLRFGYAALLGLFIALVWLGFMESARRSTAAYRIAHMSEMGKQIVSWIVCFQFAAAQLVAIVLLSTSISEEIYQRTLVPILTTPIRYWQIVTGKFLGKLLHVGFLLAISLPLMGMVRVLGGVPWGYLLAGLCITVTAAMLTGAIAMFFSILCRRAYLSILASLGVGVGLYGMVGLVFLILAMVALTITGSRAGMNLVLYPNPVAAMVYETVVLNDPSAKVPGFFWPLHCLAMLALTFVLLKLCEILVRRLALRKAIGLGAARVQPLGAPVAVRVMPAPPGPVLM